MKCVTSDFRVHIGIAAKQYDSNSDVAFDSITHLFSPLLIQSPSLYFSLPCQRIVQQSTAIPTLVFYIGTKRRRTPHHCYSYESPLPVFRGPRFQSISLTHNDISTFTTRVTNSRLFVTYPNATSSAAITGLSYTAIFRACAQKYRMIQFSPHTPDTSRCPQQPTCQEQVLPFRAAPLVDFHHFIKNRVHTVTSAPVSVSPKLA